MKNLSGSDGNIARTRLRKLSKRQLLDNVIAEWPSHLWLGWFAASPNPQQIRLNRDNCRTVREIPHQAMEQAKCLLACFPIELGDNRQWSFRFGSLGITRQYSNFYI